MWRRGEGMRKYSRLRGKWFLKQKTDPKRGAPRRCYHLSSPTASTSPSTIIAWWPAGLLLPVTLARHLGLGELVDRRIDLGRAPGRGNVRDKVLTLVASALAGGDCIDAADALSAGGTDRVLGCTVKAPSTRGTFRRSFRWGHVRQLDRVPAVAGPGLGCWDR